MIRARSVKGISHHLPIGIDASGLSFASSDRGYRDRPHVHAPRIRHEDLPISAVPKAPSNLAAVIDSETIDARRRTRTWNGSKIRHSASNLIQVTMANWRLAR